MKNFKKLMLMILLSNITIFAESGLNFPDDNGLTNPATSSHFASQQLPVSVLFVNVSLTYSQPIIRMFCFMYAVVAESSYSRMMSLSFWGGAESMKRNEGVLSSSDGAASMKRSKAVFSLPDMDKQEDNVLRIILPEDTSSFTPDDGPQSPYFIGSPKLLGDRKRFINNS